MTHPIDLYLSLPLLGAMGVRDHIDDDAGDDEDDDDEEQEDDDDNDNDDEDEEDASASAQGLGPGLGLGGTDKGSDKVESSKGSGGAFSMEQSVAYVREKARQRSGAGDPPTFGPIYICPCPCSCPCICNVYVYSPPPTLTPDLTSDRFPGLS